MVALQVIGSYIRDDRERWDCRGSGNSDITVFRLEQIINGNRNLSDGRYDDCLYPTSYVDLLPTMGWHVLWPFNPAKFHG